MLNACTYSSRRFLLLVACLISGWSSIAAPARASAGGSPEVEPVRLVAEDKVELRGDYYAPYKGKDRAPAVLLIHDAGADRTAMNDLAERLQRKGLGVLAIDLRGHGQSADEDNAWESLDEAKRTTQWTYALRDVEAAAQWLSDRRELHASNLTLVGHGAGAALALRQAGRDERVRAGILIEPKLESFGFEMADDLAEVEGLPLQLVASRDQADTWDKLYEDFDGEGWLELNLLRAEPGAVLADRRLSKNLTEWVEVRVLESGGEGTTRATAGRSGR
jgi:pimeloyl-ACP methyl ester carboxylesterase